MDNLYKRWLEQDALNGDSIVKVCVGDIETRNRINIFLLCSGAVDAELGIQDLINLEEVVDIDSIAREKGYLFVQSDLSTALPSRCVKIERD